MPVLIRTYHLAMHVSMQLVTGVPVPNDGPAKRRRQVDPPFRIEVVYDPSVDTQ